MNSIQRLEHKRQRAERAHAARVDEKRKRRRWDSFTDWARSWAGVILTPVAHIVGRLGIHPNTITILGMLLQVGVGIIFGLGHIVLGGCLLLIVAPVDALDGALARALGEESRFGSFLDSTLDRLSDSTLIIGLMVHYMNQEAHLEVALLLVSMVAVMMVSYVRARSEALGVSCKVGILTRLERVVLIGALSAVGLPGVMVWVLAVLSVFTVAQRFFHVYVAFRREDVGS